MSIGQKVVEMERTLRYIESIVDVMLSTENRASDTAGDYYKGHNAARDFYGKELKKELDALRGPEKPCEEDHY